MAEKVPTGTIVAVRGLHRGLGIAKARPISTRRNPTLNVTEGALFDDRHQLRGAHCVPVSQKRPDWLDSRL